MKEFGEGVELYLDVTQSFRSIGFGALLYYLFHSQLEKGQIADIYYAQILDPNCNPGTEGCEFEFLSLKAYLELAELVEEINLFLKSWEVLVQEKREEYKRIHNSLVILSTDLRRGDLRRVGEFTEKIEREIGRLKRDSRYFYLQPFLEKLEGEIQLLQQGARLEGEGERLIYFAILAFQRRLLLHSVIFLLEGGRAILEEIAYQEGNPNLEKCLKKGTPYKIRQCLAEKGSHFPKRAFRKRGWKKGEFFEKLEEITKLRNNAAHAFINPTEGESDLKELLEYFGRLFPSTSALLERLGERS